MNARDRMSAVVYAGFFLAGSISSKIYSGSLENYVHGYVHDVTGPACFYFAERILGQSRFESASITFLYCSLYEVTQRLGLIKGSFDPYDFVAYGVGVGLALGLDRLTFGKNKGLEEMVMEK